MDPIRVTLDKIYAEKLKARVSEHQEKKLEVITRVGVVLSRMDDKVYCIDGSSYHKNNWRELMDAEIVFISPEHYRNLLLEKSLDNWNVDDVLAHQAK